LTHYPVFTLTAVGVVGCIFAIAVLLAGLVWLAVLVFAATTLILCWLIAVMIRRSAR
jgi:hypothetical protein